MATKMTDNAAEMASSTADREIVISRVMNAPRDLVVKAWTDPAHWVRWWGPNGFTNSMQEMEVREGGHSKYIMHGPDGTDWPNYIAYRVVDLPNRLAYLHGAFAGDPNSFEAEVLFEDLGPKTKVTLRTVFASKEVLEQVKAFGAVEGGMQNLERMEKAVTSRPKEFTISRTFDAPLDLVWTANSESRHLKHWWGPKDFTCSIPRMAFVPGGMMHYCLKNDQGFEMWGRLAYRRIVPKESITAIVSFSDAKGGITRHPGSPKWPLEMLSTTTFIEKDGKTTETITWSPVNAGEEEIAAFEAGFDGMNEGFEGTFQAQGEYVAKLKAGKGEPDAKRLEIVRVFDAPTTLVWKAWTDPEAMKKWWGPKGWTCPVARIDFRVGGKYLLCMAPPEGEGAAHWVTGVFKEIIPGRKFVATDSFSDKDGNVVDPSAYGMAELPRELRWIVTLEEIGGRTRMTLVHEGMPGGVHSDMANAGWNEIFDKLADSVLPGATRLKPDWEVRIQRVFDGPKDLIYDIFTKPEHLAHWWGPKGFTLPFCEMELKDGGAYTWVMRAPDGSDHPMRGRFIDVVPGKSFGFIARLDDLLPDEHEIVARMTFAEKGGKTEVSLHQTYAKVDPSLKDDAKAGWMSSADRIDEYLASRKGN